MVVKKTVELNEEIVEMGEGEDGKFHPIAIVKVKDQPLAHNDAVKDMPRWFPAMYEVVNGFTIGLGAIENFVMNMKRMNRRVKR